MKRIGRMTKLRHSFAAWLLAGAHLVDVSFGEHSITLSPAGTGDVISWSASGPAPGANQIGMNNSFIQVNAAGGIDTGAAGALLVGGTTNATSIFVGNTNGGSVSIQGPGQGAQGGTVTIGNSAGSGCAVTILSNNAAGMNITGNINWKDNSGNTFLQNVVAGGTANFITLQNGSAPVVAAAGAGAAVSLTLKSKSTGTITMQPGADSTQAMLWQQAGGTGFLIGDSTNARIGIGTTAPGNAPSNTLTVSSAGQQVGGTGQSHVMLVQNSTSASTSGAACFVGSDNSGNSRIIVDFRQSNTGTVGANITVTNAGAGAFNSGSDARLKTAIRDTEMGLKEILMLRPRDFEWRMSGRKDYGFIAQEVLEVVPTVVHVPAGKGEFLSMDYGKLTPLCVKAIQELHARIEALEAKRS